MDSRAKFLRFDVRAWRPLARIEEREWGRADALIALGAMAVGAVLAFYAIGRESLWLDEATTYARSSMPLSELVADTIRAHHVPTYFLLIHFWLPLGDSEVMLRTPSALASIAAVGTTYCLGRVAGNRLTGAAGALLLAVSPYHIKYAQEARMYAHLTLAAAACMTGVIYLVRHPDRAAIPLVKRDPEGKRAISPALWAWCLVVVGVTAALYLHNMATLFAATLGVVAALSVLAASGQRLPLLKNWGIAGAASVLVYLPWFRIFLRQATTTENEWGNLSKSYVSASMQDLFVMPRNAPVMTLLALSLVLVALVASWRRGRLVPWSLLLFMLLPIVMAVLASLKQSVFSPRTLIGCTPAAHVLVALGATYLAAPLGPLLLALLLFLRVQLLPRHYAHHKKEAWREALTYIARSTKPATAVVAIGGREHKQIQYYYARKSRPIPSRPFRLVGTGDVLRFTASAPSVVALYLERRRPKAEPVLAKLSTVWQPGKLRRFYKIDAIELTRRLGEPPATVESAPVPAPEPRAKERHRRKKRKRGSRPPAPESSGSLPR